ncbi:MAG TPA: class I SAM-dependent methyltransferase [Bacillota bacterium]|nr:class I SAM-dependent methyltransferase [Bacillota bacterium]
MGLFSGTAAYYDKFRPGLPDAVVARIMDAVAEPLRLLDLGTGTGRVLEQFAPYFKDIIAVEPDTEMLDIARRRLHAFPAHFTNTTAENMMLPDGWQASLVTICRAFHWMDQKLVLQHLESAVAPAGVIAVFSDNSFWHGQDVWAEIITTTLARYLGPKRRTALGSYKRPLEYFGDTFISPVFTKLERHTVPVVRQWTADQIVGYLYSTSFASKEVLGNKAETFEQELRTRLREFSPENNYTEHNQFDILLASRA